MYKYIQDKCSEYLRDKMIMNKLTSGTYFSGGGVFEARMTHLCEVLFAVEYDPAIAEVYRLNFGLQPVVSRVQDVNPANLPYVNWFHASPVCKNFSVAKKERVESREEITQVLACLRYIKHHRPEFVSFENVQGWAKSRSCNLVKKALKKYGYAGDWVTVNSADYGVPQTRKRFIMMYSRTQTVSIPDKTHRGKKAKLTPSSKDLPLWVSWYEAIEDLIPTLPESQFADWQLKRLPVDVQGHLLIDCKNGLGGEATRRYRNNDEPCMTVTTDFKNSHAPKAYLIPGDNTSNDTVRVDDEPMVTVRTRSTGQCPARAFILDGQSVPDKDDGHDAITVRQEDEPMHTIDVSCYKRPSRAYTNGRVVKMTPRALARFMSMPDSYILPEKDKLACTIIGNGVPSLLALRIAENFYTAFNSQKIAA